MLSTSNDNSAEQVLKSALRIASLKMMAAFLIAFVLLESVVLYRAQTAGFEKISQWVNSKKPQIEQALFLENQFSVRGIVKNFSSQMPIGVNARIGVFNRAGEPIEGDVPLPAARQFGLKQHFFTNSFSYFDPLEFGDQTQGFLVITGTLDYGPMVLNSLITLIFIMGMFLVLNGLLRTFFRVTAHRILEPIYQLRTHIAGSAKHQGLTTLDLSNSAATTEVLELVDRYNSMVEHIHDQQRHIGRMAGQKAAALMARQVAHDIRSPLTALNMIASSTKSLPEAERTILRSAIKRISDIANHLTGQELTDAPAKSTAAAGNKVELVSGLVSLIASEKRMQYRLDTDVKVEENYTREALRLFSNINANEFKRAISNIVDNAKEAARDGSVQIFIHVKRVGSDVVISVTDDGIGMSRGLLAKVGRQGFTFGKSAGSGLGLSHARRTLKAWGGRLQIESVEKEGTTVHVILPMAEPPQWFVGAIELDPSATICIVDDDDAIHQTWKQVLKAHPRPENIQHFTQIPTEPIVGIEASHVVYFVDFEFGGDDNGLSFLKTLDRASARFLVTSHWEDEMIRQVVVKEGIKLIPKALVPYVTVTYASPAAEPTAPTAETI